MSQSLQRFSTMELANGKYDVIVVEATDRGDGVIAVEVAVSSGPMRGHVVTVLARGLNASVIDLLAAPATLLVRDDEPSLILD